VRLTHKCLSVRGGISIRQSGDGLVERSDNIQQTVAPTHQPLLQTTSGISQDNQSERPISISDFLRGTFNMGIPDDLSRSHDQLEEDGTVEEDQLLVSLRFLGFGSRTYPQCD
jgi:hypothetical protein